MGHLGLFLNFPFCLGKVYRVLHVGRYVSQSQHNSSTNCLLRQCRKGNSTLITFTNIETKVLNKILAKRVKWCIKTTAYANSMEFIMEILLQKIYMETVNSTLLSLHHVKSCLPLPLPPTKFGGCIEISGHGT